MKFVILTKLRYQSLVVLGVIGFVTATTAISPLALAKIQGQKLPKPQVVAQYQDKDELERSLLVREANDYYNQGNFTDAEEKLQKLLKKFPKDVFGHYQLGNVLYRQGKSEEAINYYQKAITLNPSHAVAYNAIGIVYAKQGKWEEAITVYQKALNINRNYGDAVLNLGEALWEQGKKDEAITYLEKARDIFQKENKNQRVKQIEKFIQNLKKQDDPSIS
jgi:tetratricopeptide (TPR) repeat protein